MAMIMALGFSGVALAASFDEADAAFLSRVENTQWLDSTGKPLTRILRDAQGRVEHLRLSGMRLSAADFVALGRIRTLRSLVLYDTNTRDEHLRQLRELQHLEVLNLTSTEVTDAAVDEILKLKSLRALCLGNVTVGPEAVARLKEHFRAHQKPLSLGYSLRK
jgi:hypothetical protein